MKITFFQKSLRAYTITELLVVLALFSSISTISLGALFNVRSINARLQEEQAVTENLDFSLQTMIRDIRFGTDFYCAYDLPTSIPRKRKNCSYSHSEVGQALIFRPIEATSSQDRVAYFIENNTVFKREYINQSTTTLQITSDDVYIEHLAFYVSGALSSDAADNLNEPGTVAPWDQPPYDADFAQPLITIVMTGSIRNSRFVSSSTLFHIQTSVSPTILDNK